MKEHVIFAIIAVAFGLAGAMLPAGAQGGDPRVRVAAILAKVRPYDPVTRNAATEELVSGGAALLPAIREAMASAEETRREALDSAVVRLTWKTDPVKKVAAWMAAKQQNGPFARLPEPVRISSAALDALFPDRLFYAVVVRQFPLARPVSPPFNDQNVVVYHRDGSIDLQASPEAMQTYFKRSLAPAQNQGDAVRVMAAWLRLTQTYSEDGMFRFTIPMEQIKTAWQPSGGLVVTGKALVVAKGGDSGEIDSTLTFIGQGTNPRRLVSIHDKRDVHAGVRPICQATKLLDRDPIVRRMAEQDLMVMGSAAWSYIGEQREKASPELRSTIDRIWKRILAEKR